MQLKESSFVKDKYGNYGIINHCYLLHYQLVTLIYWQDRLLENTFITGGKEQLPTLVSRISVQARKNVQGGILTRKR